MLPHGRGHKYIILAVSGAPMIKPAGILGFSLCLYSPGSCRVTRGHQINVKALGTLLDELVCVVHWPKNGVDAADSTKE